MEGVVEVQRALCEALEEFKGTPLFLKGDGTFVSISSECRKVPVFDILTRIERAERLLQDSYRVILYMKQQLDNK